MKNIEISTIYRSAARVALVTVCLLLIPMLAMQFTNEVAWDLTDFVVAGVLLFGSGLIFELVARRENGLAYGAAIGIAVAATLILVWANLAVGLIGAAGDSVNLMYFGVLAIGFIGALVTRLRARGMALVLLMMATAQVLVAFIALFFGLGESFEIALLNGLFVILYGGSALLFWRASTPLN